MRSMIGGFSTIYWLKDFATGKTRTFHSEDPNFDESVLRELNERGYNVYRSVNTFVGGSRKAEDLGEIRACFVDVDYPEANGFDSSRTWAEGRSKFFREKFETSIRPAIARLEREYGITPSELNLTHKGFHILYEYEDECHYVDPEIHKSANATIGDAFAGDPNARDVSRVYKSVGYADWKGGYRWTIRSLISEPASEGSDVPRKYVPKKISKLTLEERFGLKWKGRDVRKAFARLERHLGNALRSEENRKKIDSMDSKEFVDSVRNYVESLAKRSDLRYPAENVRRAIGLLSYVQRPGGWYSLCEEDGVTPTSGLVLVDAGGSYQMHDYSRHFRSSNVGFLRKWILPALWVTVENSGRELNVFLHSSVWIGLNSVPRKTLPLDKKLFHDYFHGRVRFPWIGPAIVLSSGNPLSAIPQIPSVAKTYFALFAYLRNRIDGKSGAFVPGPEGYFVEYLDFYPFAFPGIDTASKRKHHKKKLASALGWISKMEVLFESEAKDSYGWKRVVEISFPNVPHSRGRKDGFYVKPLQDRTFSFSQADAFLNADVLSFQDSFGDTRVTDFLLYAITMAGGTARRDFTIRADYVSEYLGLEWIPRSRGNTIRKHLKEAVERGIFKSYSVVGWRVTLSNRKESGS